MPHFRVKSYNCGYAKVSLACKRSDLFFMSADVLKNLSLLKELKPIIKLEQRVRGNKESHLYWIRLCCCPKYECFILGISDQCPVHLPGQNIFCPGQNQICPRQNNFVIDKIYFVHDKNFVHSLKIIFALGKLVWSHGQNFCPGQKIFCPRQNYFV